MNYAILETATPELIDEVAVALARRSGADGSAPQVLRLQLSVVATMESKQAKALLDGRELLIPVEARHTPPLHLWDVERAVEKALGAGAQVTLVSHSKSISHALYAKASAHPRLRVFPVPSDRLIHDTLQVLVPEMRTLPTASVWPSRIEPVFSLQRACLDRRGLAAGLSKLLGASGTNIKYLSIYAFGLTARFDLVARLPQEVIASSTPDRTKYCEQLRRDIEQLLEPLVDHVDAFDDDPANSRRVARELYSTHHPGFLAWRGLPFQPGVLAELLKPLDECEGMSVSSVVVHTRFYPPGHESQEIKVEVLAPNASVQELFKKGSALHSAYFKLSPSPQYAPTTIRPGPAVATEPAKAKGSRGR